MADQRLDDIDRLLAERGHDFAFGRIRVAAGRSGIAVAFPDKPMIHVSWWPLAACAVFACVRRRQRGR